MGVLLLAMIDMVFDMSDLQLCPLFLFKGHDMCSNI